MMNPKAVANVVKFYKEAATKSEEAKRAGDINAMHAYGAVADTLFSKSVELHHFGQPEANDAIWAWEVERLTKAQR